ncbi:MAG: hypothetical protein ACYC0F_05245 [Rhodanobacter sp.]
MADHAAPRMKVVNVLSESELLAAFSNTAGERIILRHVLRPVPRSVDDTAVFLWWIFAALLLGFALQAFAAGWWAVQVEQHCGDTAGAAPRVVVAQCAEPEKPASREGQHVVHGAQHAGAQGGGA